MKSPGGAHTGTLLVINNKYNYNDGKRPSLLVKQLVSHTNRDDTTMIKPQHESWIHLEWTTSPDKYIRPVHNESLLNK